jgi:hypothetical protein
LAASLPLIVLAAIGSAGGSKNTLAPTVPPAGRVAVAPGSAEAEGAAASPDTTRYAVGSRIRLDYEEYITVEKAEQGFTSRLAKPAAGKANVSLLVAFEGIKPGGATYNPLYFSIKDDRGFEYHYSAFGKEPQLGSSNSLQPGKVRRSTYPDGTRAGWWNFKDPVWLERDSWRFER